MTLYLKCGCVIAVKWFDYEDVLLEERCSEHSSLLLKDLELMVYMFSEIRSADWHV